MNLPTILFRRSHLYDVALKREKKYENPDEKRVAKAFKDIQKKWAPWEKIILEEISKTTHLPWNEKEIVVYFSYGVYAYSDPLTINLVSDIHVLTHELIHRIISEPENWERIKKNWNAFLRNYKDEDIICRTHIIVHAIHLHILEKYFSKKNKWTQCALSQRSRQVNESRDFFY
jgi:hypothetical protein